MGSQKPSAEACVGRGEPAAAGQANNSNTVEQYWYGAEGMRVKKTRENTTTYSFFAHYEEEVPNGVTTAISYYAFGSMGVAVKRGNNLYHLHGDHLGSTSLTTRGSAETANRAYHAYGTERSRVRATSRPTAPSPARSPTPQD